MNIITKYLFALASRECVLFLKSCQIDTHCLNVKITCLLINRDQYIGRFKHIYEMLNFPCIILKRIKTLASVQSHLVWLFHWNYTKRGRLIFLLGSYLGHNSYKAIEYRKWLRLDVSKKQLFTNTFICLACREIILDLLSKSVCFFLFF